MPAVLIRLQLLKRSIISNRTADTANGGKMSSDKIKKLTMMGMLTALVMLLQMVVHIKFGIFSMSTVLIPIVVGAALYGVLAGAWLGLVFALAVFLSGDAAFFLGINMAGTIITVTAKGIACGAAAGLIYKMLKRKNEKAAVIAASITCPVVNTGVFIIGCLIFFSYDMKYILTAFVGVNFLVELIANAVLSSTIMFLIKRGKGRN